MYSEDLALCWTLRQAGWLVEFEPRAQVVHVGSAAALQAFGDTIDERRLEADFSGVPRNEPFDRLYNERRPIAQLRLGTSMPLSRAALGALPHLGRAKRALRGLRHTLSDFRSQR